MYEPLNGTFLELCQPFLFNYHYSQRYNLNLESGVKNSIFICNIKKENKYGSI